MSFHRENVVWKSSSGTWGIGFFESEVTGDDAEWDVEYDHSRFEWASVGHATEEQAHQAWQGANPGSCWVHETPSDETDRYDDMANTWISENRSHSRKVWR